MYLVEAKAKQVFERGGLQIPLGALVSSSSQVASALIGLKAPFMVKAQVAVGGRGKAGGVIAAASVHEAEKAVDKLLGAKIKGTVVRQVLIEEKLPVKREIYLSFAVDRQSRSYSALTSSLGGVDIEETAKKNPSAIFKATVDPQLGLRFFHAISIAKSLGYSGSQLLDLSTTIQHLYQVIVDCDAELAEINPLVETEPGSFVAVDAHIVIDDNALYRHPEFQAEKTETLSPQEILAARQGLAYVKLDGDIGIVGNGAGLVMATIDLLGLFGGKPADFLDVGGGASKEAVKTAVQIVLADMDVKALLVNVLGGITRCDEVAEGIVEAVKAASSEKPLAVRLVGTNEAEGQRILGAAGISVFDSMEEAARQAVKYTIGGLG